MTREDLFLAVGEAVQEMSSGDIYKEETMNNKPVRRILRSVLVAAAMVALLVTTVWAAPLLREIFGQITGDWEAILPTDGSGSSQQGTATDIHLDLELNDDAPEVVELFYMPSVPEQYPHSFGFAYAGMDMDRLCVLTWGWDVPGGELEGIMFHQMTGEAFREDFDDLSVYTADGKAPKMEQVTLGGISGLLVHAPDMTQWGRKHFYWSDGDYVFYMRFPYAFTEADMSACLEGFAAVENPEDYMISMTEEQREQTFD